MTAFSRRIDNMARSASIIKYLFSSMTNPGTISFGGGAPANEALPVDKVREICNDVLRFNREGITALQYGDPQGLLELREVVCKYLMKPKGVEVTPANVLITTGGLETMNLICQIFINPGDVILVESPTFVHCVEIFEMFEARCIAVATDDQGMVPEDLEDKMKKLHPKMVYVVPTFQNPTGKTLPLERRKKLAELGSRYDVMILEDDPYRDIRYSGKDLPPIKIFDQTGHTVLANSFSKIFSPGSRLGYVIASEKLIQLFYQVQTATISHTSNLTQVICAEFFRRGFYPEHHKMICDMYRERRDIMLGCLDKYFPKGTWHTYPDGGLFIWVELPEQFNTTELLKEANDKLVAYVPGEGFYAEGGGKGRNAMRISFSGVEPEKIKIGMKRLGALLCSKM